MTTEQYFDMSKKVIKKLKFNPKCTYFYPQGYWVRVISGKNPPIKLIDINSQLN